MEGANKIFYALEAVLLIACQSGGTPLSSRTIAQQQGLPPRMLELLLQKLVQGGILRGIRGPKGGYVLAKERRRISLGDICDVIIDGEMHEYHLTPLGNSLVFPIWKDAHLAWLSVLNTVNLAELCEVAARKHIQELPQEKMDFTI